MPLLLLGLVIGAALVLLYRSQTGPGVRLFNGGETYILIDDGALRLRKGWVGARRYPARCGRVAGAHHAVAGPPGVGLLACSAGLAPADPQRPPQRGLVQRVSRRSGHRFADKDTRRL